MRFLLILVLFAFSLYAAGDEYTNVYDDYLAKADEIRIRRMKRKRIRRRSYIL